MHYVDKAKKDALWDEIGRRLETSRCEADCRHENVRLRHKQALPHVEASQVGPASLEVPQWPHHEESVSRDCRVLV